MEPDPNSASGSVSIQSAPRRHALGALRFRDFRWFWIGQSSGFAGFWLLQVLQGWLVLELTDSPLMVSLVQTFNMVPMLVSSLPGGILADRVDRRKLLLATRTVVALLLATLAFGAIARWITTWEVFAIAMLTGAMWALDNPSRQALTASLVDEAHVMNAVAFNFVSMSATRILGPTAAAVLVAAVGLRLPFILPAVGAAGMLVGLFMMRVPVHPSPENRPSMLRELRNGLGYIRRNRPVLALVLTVAMVELLAWAYMPLMPVIARDVLGGTASDLGILMAASGVGSLAGALFLAFIGRSRAKGWWLLLAVALFGGTEVLLGLSHWYALSFAILIVVGACGTAYMTLNNTILLTVAPEELRGRVMSIYSLSFGVSGLGAAAAGAIAQAWGAPITLVLSGLAGMAVAGSVALLAPGLRRLR